MPKGTFVSQGNPPTAAGRVKSDAKAGDTSLTVSYTSTCKKGGSSSPVETGCFKTSALLSAGGVSIGQPSAVTNKYRTLAGFSTAALKKMKGQVFFDVYHCYYTHGDYADKYVTAALDGTGIFTGQPEAARIQGAKKGSAYMNVWMYVIREMEDAVVDCKSGCMKCNDDPVHAWDEAVAFYSGSLEKWDGSGSGKLLYALADKRCANFGTCTGGATGNSKVNTAIIEQFTLGKNRLLQGKCADVTPIKNRIVELMSIPLVQGSLRYAYKVGTLGEGDKARAEGAAFSAAILPRGAACNNDAAKLISDNMAIDSTASMKSGFAAVKSAFESTYACMGMTCEDVGGLTSGSGSADDSRRRRGSSSSSSSSSYADGAAPCARTPEPTGAAHCSAGAISLITGYHTQTDVTQHSLIDLDQKEMEAHLGATPVAFDKAKQIYASGGNSGGTAVLMISALQASVTKGTYVSQGSPPTAEGRVKSAAKAGDTSLTVSYTSMCKKGGSSSPVETGCFTVSIVLSVGDVSIGQPSAVTNKYRTLAGFSTAALKKMKGQVFFDVYHCYYTHGDYADKYVTAALDGTGIFKELFQ